MKHLVTRLWEHFDEFESLNLTSDLCTITINGQIVEQVQNFRYLGCNFGPTT